MRRERPSLASSSWRSRPRGRAGGADERGRETSCMTDRIFVDTNVWVYAVDHADPGKQARAAELLGSANAGSIVISAQVLGEFYTAVTSKLAQPVGKDEAAGMVEHMRRLPVLEITGDRVAAAIAGSRSWQLSYWDALIVVTAQ